MATCLLRRSRLLIAALRCAAPAARAFDDFAFAPAVGIALPSVRLVVPVVVAMLVGARAAHAVPGELVLAAPETIPLGAPASDLRVLDVSGDGIPDLIAVAPTAPGLQVLLGQGDGTFGAPVLTPIADIRAFELGDVNGDGDLDVVTVLDLGSSTFILQAHLGDGSGAFVLASGLDVSIPGDTYALALFDADEDGDLDALLEQTGQLRLCLGDGAGGFAAPGPFIPPQFGLFQELYVLDANGDGHLDIVGSGYAFFFAGWFLFLGDGAGGLTFTEYGFASVDGSLFGSAIGDFDGDHRTDFVLDGLNGQCGGACYVLAFTPGTGSGFAFPPPNHILAPGPSRIRAGDLDGDGLADVVGTSGTQLWVFLSKGDFSVFAPQFLSLDLPAVDLTLADVDGDARLDLLALHPSGSATLFLNRSPPSGWTDLGHGLAGVDGIPSLLGVGELEAGAPGALKLTHANPNKLAALVVGPTGAPTPFKGGTLVPVPPTMVFMMGTSPTGTITVPWNNWPHLPVGTDYFFQFAIVDSAAPAGASLSNAVRALQP